MMNTPNKITLSRIIGIPIYCIFMSLNSPLWTAFAGAVFTILASTDYLDGYLARKNDLVTDLGKFMDPLADKLLVLAAASIFVGIGRISAYALIIIMARDLAIQSLRTIAAANSRVLAADSLGKIKTATQLVSLGAMHFEAVSGFDWFTVIINLLFMFSLAMTVLSGANYMVRNFDVMLAEK